MKTLAHPRHRAQILERLKTLRPDSAARWGRMSAHQMVCHLNDSFRMATDRKPISFATGLRQRTIVKWIALYAPLRWPAGIRTRPEVDQELDGTRPVAFADDVAQLEALIERFATCTPGIESVLHPIFARMSRSAWLRWGYLHADHHLRQFGV